MNIFIAKLNPGTTSEDLESLFSEYGEVSSAKVIMDRETGRSKCFGFVEMDDDGDANAAIDGLNETTLQDNTIVVKEARPREERPRSGGFGGGNRGGYGGGRSNDRRGGGGYGGGSGGGRSNDRRGGGGYSRDRGDRY